MPKFVDDAFAGKEPIGRQGLLNLIDDMNRRRAYFGIRERYKPVENDNGELMMAKDWITVGNPANTPSPVYSAPRTASNR